ncbi:plasmid maintenance protein CcdB [Roseomonas stagni]|uniref:Toxin CcdB n=1 Tax=Falsiroseomonas algicola TaxID=2716930 RepID=A0A6M1LRV9_9PROT|nr:CcdB family protein [Falsiroseomonas algicola]NGM23160.1 plasmid maintenance protein CcdB [Falsiroseomonas algicola]
MARFDLYRPKGSAAWLLDVQADFLDHLRTRVVVPLLPPDGVPARITDLHPAFEVEGQRLLMATQLMAAVPRRDLGRPVGNLAPHRDDITRALDLLLTGF